MVSKSAEEVLKKANPLLSMLVDHAKLLIK